MSNYNYHHQQQQQQSQSQSQQQQQQQQQQSQSQQQSQQQQGFVQCLTIREFWGDANLNQLCFKVHTQIEVDFSRPPQNGWQWGRIHTLQGWCPEWSITPVGAVVPPASASASSSSSLSSSQYSRPPQLRRVLGLVQPHSIIPPHQSQQSRERNSLRRSSDYVTPLQRIVEGNQEHETTHDSMGGTTVPQAQKTTTNGSLPILADNSSNMENHRHHNDKKNAFENVPDSTITTTTTTTSCNNNNNKWNSGIKKLFLQTKIGIINSNNNNNEISSAPLSYQNPYTQKQDILDSDWTEASQIMNTNTGRMTIVETDGHTTNYQNEATYHISTKTTDIADQVKTTTSHLAQQISNWKMSPTVLGMSNMNNNNNDNGKKNGSNDNNATHNEQKRQQQDEQQQEQKNQSVKIVKTNNQQQEQKPSTTTTTNKYKYKFGDIIMPSSFTFPTIIPKIPRSSSSKEQPPQISTTTYCDRNGNEQTLVEENRRQASHTWMDLSY